MHVFIAVGLHVPLRNGVCRKDTDTAAYVAKKVENTLALPTSALGMVPSATFDSGTKTMLMARPPTTIDQKALSVRYPG
jgi:hypothetical protein